MMYKYLSVYIPLCDGYVPKRKEACQWGHLGDIYLD